MKKLGLFLAALTAVSFASCDGVFGAPKGAAPEQGAAAVPRVCEWYWFYGKNGKVKEGLQNVHFTEETRKFLDPKYVGTDTVLETSIYWTDFYHKVLAAFEEAGIPTYDHVQTSNWFKDNHFKFNMKDVTALEIR